MIIEIICFCIVIFLFICFAYFTKYYLNKDIKYIWLLTFLICLLFIAYLTFHYCF